MLNSKIMKFQFFFKNYEFCWNFAVTPICEQQSIKVTLTFNDHEWSEDGFMDWIVVGTNNRAECRLKGNGELKYAIELAIFNDPCQTQMVGYLSKFKKNKQMFFKDGLFHCS